MRPYLISRLILHTLAALCVALSEDKIDLIVLRVLIPALAKRRAKKTAFFVLISAQPHPVFKRENMPVIESVFSVHLFGGKD